MVGRAGVDAAGVGDGARAVRRRLLVARTEGGLDRAQATCVVDKFFSTRSTDELKKFFARKDLTAAERADFAAIAKACTP